MYEPKRGWKSVTSGKLYEIYQEACEEARRLGYLKEENPPLYINSSYRTLGTHHWQRRNGVVNRAITISKHIVDNPNVRKVIIHEVGHASCNVKAGHSSIWYYRVNQIGKKWGIVNSMYEDDKSLLADIRCGRPVPSDNKYELYCPKCGQVWGYKTKCQAIKNPSKYYCKKCKVDLKSREL